ncbi:MAG: hypothetical protein ACLQG5_00155 [Methanobacterium sp.]|jgi:hypothetical protein
MRKVIKYRFNLFSIIFIFKTGLLPYKDDANLFGMGIMKKKKYKVLPIPRVNAE